MTGVWGFADLHCHPMAHLAFGCLAHGKQLFIDIDHMSQHSAEDALTLAETYGYPMVASPWAILTGRPWWRAIPGFASSGCPHR